MIKVIIFDLVGVIFEKAFMISHVLVPMSGLKNKKEDVLSLYIKYDLGKITEKEFWTSLVGKKYKKFQKKFLDLYKLDPNYHEITKLKKKYRIAILGNFPSEHGKYLNKKFGFNKLFEQVMFSGDYGLMKDNPKLFKLLLSKLKVKPQECCFIADRIHDLMTASELGIKTIWMQRFKPDFTITSLKEIKNLNILKEG